MLNTNGTEKSDLVSPIVEENDSRTLYGPSETTILTKEHRRHYGRQQLNLASAVFEKLCDMRVRYFVKTNLQDVAGDEPHEFLLL